VIQIIKYCVGFCIQNSYCVGEAGKSGSSVHDHGSHAGTSSEVSGNHGKESSSSSESSVSSSEVSVHGSLTLLNSTCRIVIQNHV
jgi:hypothetical protein